MVITIEIPDEVVERAQSLGLTAESYVAGLIASQNAPAASDISKEARKARLEQFFVEMAAHSHKVPMLPDQALTRESFYSDHD